MQSSRDSDRIERFRKATLYPVGLVIVDECHFLTTESYTTALSYFPEAKVLGVTATPFRDRMLMTNIFDKISYSISLQELIDQGYLVPPKLKGYVVESGMADDRMAMVAALYNDHEQGRKAIVFVKTIEDATTLRNVFENMGVPARAVTCDLTGDNRDEVLSDFRTGKTMVLTTVNVLTAGFDAPCVEAIFLPYNTDSPTLYMQRIGRGLRLDPCNPEKKECRVYVMGDAPSISSQMYERLNRHTLDGTAEWKERKTFTDDLAFNLPSGESAEIYQWTTKVVEVVEKLERLGLSGVARVLNEKKFPPKFLGKLDKIVAKLAVMQPPVTGRSATKQQVEQLFGYGFPRPESESLTKGEAAMVVAAMQMMLSDGGPFVLTKGKYSGKHVKDLPLPYQQVVLNKFPNSEVAGKLREWQKQSRRA